MKKEHPFPRHTLEEVFEQHYRALKGRQQEENDFFASIREESYHFFTEQGIPTRKGERYRYTPLIERLTPIFEQGMDARQRIATHPSLPRQLQGMEAYTLTLHNGRPLAQPKGDLTPFEVYPLEKGSQQYPEEVKAYFHRQAKEGQDPWVALNAALWDTGCLVYLPPHTRVERPLIVHHFIEGPTPTALHPRLLFVMGEHSRATLIETSTASHGAVPSFVNRVAEIVLREGSHLTHYALQIADAPAYELRYTYVRQEGQSHFAHYLTAACPDAALVRDEVEVQLEGPHAEAYLHGLYRSAEAQHLALHPSVHHRSPSTTTSQHYKGMGEGSSTTLFDGYIHVAPQGQKTVASQQHKGWILGERASTPASWSA